MKASGLGTGILAGFLLVLIFFLIFYIYYNGGISGIFNHISNGISSSIGAVTNPGQGSQSGTTIPQENVSAGQQGMNLSALDAYALSLINADRHDYGLSNVTLSDEGSGQQHADSMLRHGYFSHWDIYGMKPYMRYTLMGGRGAVEENVAYIISESCGALGCSGALNVKNAIKEIEYNMMYNDSACCNNGHRDNILDRYHNQVSLGIAYNSSNIYMVEDFIDNYISWGKGMPSYSNPEVYLSGAVLDGYGVSEVIVSYDAPVSNMSTGELMNTSSYSYGVQAAGIAKDSGYYYPNVTTIIADRYITSGHNFTIDFSMDKLYKQRGAGEYTVIIWLKAPGLQGFVGSSYTLFVNGSGVGLLPSGI